MDTFPFLIALTTTLKTRLNRSIGSWHSCLFPNRRWKRMLAIIFYVRRIPSIPSLLSVFFSISASIEMIMCFSLIFWMWCIMLINLYVETSYIPWINSTWSCCTILLLCDQIRFAIILLREFASIFIRHIVL